MNGWRQRRRALIDAQRAIFDNHDREQAAGITDETDEYLRLHRDYYALADREPWWIRVGTWRAALSEHTHGAGVQR